MRLEFSKEIKEAAPGLKAILIEADVENHPTCDRLWNEIEEEARRIKDTFAIGDVNKREGIAATRMAYKALGKDPNRYRPSSEALCRRIVNGKGIYRLTTLIDLINLLSITSGYSIGGFDGDKIEGDTLTLRRGTANDVFEGIGRGPLNIEGLPVYHDASGGIGTPTSDEERTKLTPDTKRLVMVVNVYGEEMPTDETIALARRLLCEYAGVDDRRISVKTFHAT